MSKHVEIERRFLVITSQLPALTGRKLLRQGYVSKDPWVRFRTWADGAQLTIKGKGDIERPEVNIDIPLDKANAALEVFGKALLRKTRTVVPFAGRAWEVDEFHDALNGLWLAEIELGSFDEPFATPPWLGAEVTTDHRYSNGWLAEHGLPPDFQPT